MFRTLWRKKWLVVVPAVVSAITAWIVARNLPVEYQSETTMVLVPSSVAAGYIGPSLNQPADHLLTIAQRMLSRTRLERLIDQYGLYKEARARLVTEEVVEQMRREIAITTDDDPKLSGARTLKVSFRATDPRVAQKVASELATFMVVDNVQDQSNETESTVNLLDSLIADGKEQLESFERAHAQSGKAESRSVAIEREALEDSYRSLLTKRNNAKVAVQLTRRQYGEQLRILDSARVPERPIGFTLRQITAGGTLVGLVFGLAAVGVSARRKAKIH